MKTKLLLILPLAICSLLCACGGGQEEGGKYTLEFKLNEDGLSYAVTGISYENIEEEHNVEIPETYENLPVTILGNKNESLIDKVYNVFYNDKTLKSLTMSDNITTIIGKYLCYNCTNLETIKFSNKLKEDLGDGSFSYCESLKEAILPDTLLTLGNMFMQNSGITKLVLPKQLNRIPLRAFADNKNLNDITWPEVEFTAGGSSFCNSGLTEFTMPDTMTSAASSFSSSTKLTKVICGHGLKDLNGAFMNCPNLVEFYLKKECTSIYYNNVGEIQSSFYGCTSLHEINYEGTMNEFNTKVYKEEKWRTSGCEITKVICSDGTIEY